MWLVLGRGRTWLEHADQRGDGRKGGWENRLLHEIFNSYITWQLLLSFCLVIALLTQCISYCRHLEWKNQILLVFLSPPALDQRSIKLADFQRRR